MAVGSDYDSLRSCGTSQRRSFASRCGAQIEHAIGWLHVEQQRDGLRSFILNGNCAGAEGFGARGTATAYGKGGLQNISGCDAEAGVL